MLGKPTHRTCNVQPVYCKKTSDKPLSWPGAHWVQYEGDSEPTW